MEWIHKIPILRPLLAWVLGIAAALGPADGLPAMGFVMAAITAFIIGIVFEYLHYSKRAWQGIWIIAFYFFCGLSWTLMQCEKNRPTHFSQLSESGDTLLIMVNEPPVAGENTFRFTGHVKAVVHHNSLQPAEGKMVVYLEKDSMAAGLQYGYELLVNARYEELNPPANPDAFDFSRHQYYRRIYHRTFLSVNDRIYTGINSGSALWHWVYSLRAQLIRWQNDVIKEPDSRAVAHALLTGYKETLDISLRDAYAATGAMHILAVSGLHTGLVFLVFHFLLMPVERLPGGKLLKTIAILLILWIYACLTGLAPSVCRAAAMLSFVTVGLQTERITHIYQSIAISAFVLLWVDPYLLAGTGFQLSYAAVAGIVFLMPRWPELPFRAPALLIKAWQIAGVSVAAQLFTMPLTLHYFGQFPVYFIITNLLALPAAALVLYTGIAFFAVRSTGIAILWEAVGSVLNFLLGSLNLSIRFISNLPGSVMQGIWITPLQSAGLFVFLFLILLAFNMRHARSLVWAVLLLAIWLFSVVYVVTKEHTSHRLIVHDAGRETLVQMLSGNRALWISSETGSKKTASLQYAASGAMLRRGLLPDDAERLSVHNSQPIETNDIFWHSPFGRLKETTFMICDESIIMPTIASQNYLMSNYGMPDSTLPLHTFFARPPEVDLLILTGNPDKSPAELSQFISFKKAIFDNSTRPGKRRMWRNSCLQEGLRCYDVAEDGAYEIRY